ncbi:oleosin 18.2 kDa-like [Benincasa hispida]|uniref:oleosin 18.2 kDa-like n=1 Tax=Benincasa hispida TaxID=102211 RepID=UPI0019024E75|nr:oleosin 18.2 kDa-like [Benincasa hispida]
MPFFLHSNFLFFFSHSLKAKMADRPQPHQLQVHPQRRYEDVGAKGRGGPSASTILAVVTLVPLGGSLLGLAGLTLAATLFGLAVSTPVFIIFSPILVPAILTIGLAVLAFLTSGAFGLTALSSLTWAFNYLRRATGFMPDQIDQAKRRMQDMAGYVGQKTKDLGQEIQSRTQEQGRRT